jgi:O-antigen/teichoic acid export membrane protein
MINDMNNKKKSTYNLIFTVFSQVIILVIGLIIPKLFITSYGSEINGLQSSIAYIYTYIALLESGIGTATIQALYKVVNNSDKKRANAILAATHKQYNKTAWIYAVCMLCLGIIYPFTVKTQLNYWTVFFVVILSGSGSLLSFVFHGKFILLLQADGRSYLVAILNLVQYLLKNAIKIVLIFLNVPFIYIYVGELLIGFLMAAIYGLYKRKNYFWVNYSEKPNIAAISQSKNVLVHQIANIVCNSTDVLLLTYVVKDLKLVSVYSMYILVFDAVKSLIQNILSSVNFIMGQTFNSNIELYRKYHRLYEIFDFMLSFSLYSIAYLLITPFLRLYTNGITDISYIDKYLPLLFASIKLLSSGREPVAQLINYAGHFKETQYRAIMEAFINLAVSLVATYFWGIYGVLLGTIVALTYRTLDMYFYTSRRFLNRSVWVSIRHWLLYLIAFIVIVVLNYFLPIYAVSYFELLWKAVIVGVVVCLYFGICTFIFNIDEVKGLFRIAKDFILRKRGKNEDRNINI